MSRIVNVDRWMGGWMDVKGKEGDREVINKNGGDKNDIVLIQSSVAYEYGGSGE